MSEESGRLIESVASYHLLGRSGLRVSPLCLGAMTFGNDWGFGNEEDVARQVFDRYLEAGGNFIDTADMYNNGNSEKMLGRFMKDAGVRDRLVIATKFAFNMRPSDPNAGGNGRKHIMEAVEGSLRRLGTDYIDLYWMHVWDTMTPVEEVVSTFETLVRQGKVRYFGLSDIPAWYASRAFTIAELRGWEKIIALQLEYSLVERNIEHEFVPMAHSLGLAVCPWSPLGSGVLTGKYKREGDLTEGRLKTMKDSGNPAFEKLTERNFDIVDVVLDVAKELGKSPAQVALNWVVNRPGIGSTLIGATKLHQLEDNLSALEFDIPAELSRKLEEVSRLPSRFPYFFFGPAIQGIVHGERPMAAHPKRFWG